MKIGILSDSHDHLPNLRYALAELERRQIKVLFHCGDLISPFVTKLLGTFPGTVHTVFGNNDADRFLAQKLAPENVQHHGEFGFVEIDGHLMGFTHYREYAMGLAAGEQCQAAFFGHSHEFAETRLGDVLVLNPGEILGMKGAPSYCVYDTDSRDVEHIVFAHQPW